MSEPEGVPEQSDGGFLSRWSERKLALRGGNAIDDRRAVEALTRQQDSGAADEASVDTEPAVRLTDADMPAVEDLDADSDYSGFLSQGVSDALRNQALKKLFFSGSFNVVDGLDDYAEDFTRFEALGDIVTAEMRHRIEEAAKRITADGETEVVGEGTPETDPQAVGADDALANGPDSNPPEAMTTRTFKIDTDAEAQEEL